MARLSRVNSKLVRYSFAQRFPSVGDFRSCDEASATQCELASTKSWVTRNRKPQETSVVGELGVVALILPLLRKSGGRQRRTETNRYVRFCPRCRLVYPLGWPL